MAASRREFLATTAVAGLAAVAGAFPVPHWQTVPGVPLRPPSDAPPPLPDGAFRRLGSRRFRLTRGISRFQFSPSGRVLVAADSNEIRGWEVATARPLFAMPYPEKVDLNSGRVTDREVIAVLGRVEGTGRYEIHNYAFATGRTDVRTATGLQSIEGAAFSAEGTRVVALREGRLHCFDTGENRELWTAAVGAGMRGDSDLVFADGDRLLLANTPASVRRFEASTGKELDPLDLKPREKKKVARRPAGALQSICVSPGGAHVAGIGGDDSRTILFWNAATGELLLDIKQKNATNLIGFTKSGESLFVSCDGVLTEIAVATGKPLRNVDIGLNASPAISPDGTLFAVSSNDAIVLFDSATGQPLPQSADPPGLPSRLHFATPNVLVGMLNEFGGWVRWDLAADTSHLLRPTSLGEGVPLGLTGDGRVALVTGRDKLRRWDLAAGVELATMPHENNRSIPLADITRDGSRIVAATADGLTVWDAANKETRIAAGGGGAREQPDFLALSPAGDVAATALQIPDLDMQRRHFVEVYSLGNGRLLHRFRSGGHLSSIGFSPDGTRLGLGSTHNMYEGRSSRRSERPAFTVHDTLNGHQVFQLPGRRNDVRAFALSPDNRLAATAGPESNLEIWEQYSGELRMKFKLPGDATSIAFAPDSAFVVVSGSGGPVLFWDLRGTTRPTPPKPDEATCAKLLTWLTEKDATAAYEALRIIAAWPAETLPALAKAIPPVAPPDGGKLKDCVARLGAPRYADRDKATRELLELGELAAPALRAVLAETGSDEVRQRAESILDRNAGCTPADLKSIRAVEAAEWAGTPLAKQTLNIWANGAAGARLTQDAQAALRRMK